MDDFEVFFFVLVVDVVCFVGYVVCEYFVNCVVVIVDI